MKQESAVLIFRDPNTGALRRLRLTPKMLAALIMASEEIDADTRRRLARVQQATWPRAHEKSQGETP